MVFGMEHGEVAGGGAVGFSVFVGAGGDFRHFWWLFVVFVVVYTLLAVLMGDLRRFLVVIGGFCIGLCAVGGIGGWYSLWVVLVVFVLVSLLLAVLVGG